MTQSVLISLAFLQVSSRTGRKVFLDNFVPFVAEVLKQENLQTDDVISVSNLKATVKSQFGLSLPSHVLKAILFRAATKHLVRLKDKVFRRDSNKINATLFETVQNEVQVIYTALIQKFMAFSKDKHNVPFTEKEAEQVILGFIGYNQLFVFQPVDEDRVISDIPTLTPENKIIISDFVINAKERDPEAFAHLNTITTGYMIANGLYLPDVSNPKRRFRKTRVFLDTSLIMFSLGYCGSEFQAPALELLDLLYVNNAQLCCFRHTVQEIIGIMDACSYNLGKYENGTFGMSLRHFSSLGYTPSDILRLISQLDDNIKALRITIQALPNYSHYPSILDETELSGIIKLNISSPGGTRIERDVASVSAVCRIRGGHHFYNIEDSPAILVTSNNTLSSLSNEYYYRDHNARTSPPCITDFELTNVLWLKTPNQSPTLPMKRIIADSYAAIQPDEKLMAKWVGEIDRLKQRGQITEDDYYFMRYSNDAHITLAKSTLGHPDAITDGTVPQIIEAAKDRIREEVERKLKEETLKREAADAQVLQLAALRKRDAEERDYKIRLRSISIARIILAVTKVIIVVTLLLLTFLSLPFDLLLSGSVSLFIQKWPLVLRAFLFFCLFVLAFIISFFNISISAFLQKLEISITNIIFRSLKSWFG